MATFTLKDFLSDDIPECYLTNSDIVRRAVTQNIVDEGNVQDISLVGISFEGVILYEWHISIRMGDQMMFLRLPLYLPNDEDLATALMEKHSQASLENAHILHPGEYLLIGFVHPCQLILGEDGILYIKRIEIFASQKQVQDFLTQVCRYETVTAALVVISMHSVCYKGLGDIGWLINLDGVSSLMDIDRRPINKGLVVIDGFEELPQGATFGINSQHYIVDEDDENGQFIAKISAQEAKAFARAASVK